MIAVCAFSSCTNENSVTDQSSHQLTEEFEVVNLSDFIDTNSILKTTNKQVDENQTAIRFKNENAYENMIAEIQSMSKKEQLAWSAALEGFTSLQAVFEEAMIDVESIDETAASYMTFKEKYDQYLYFPMHSEDRGFYIPVIEQEKAVLANSDGLIIIGNEVKNLKNITCYADLQKTGQAYYSPENNTSTRAAVNYNTKSDFIGEEIDSGWFHDKNNSKQFRFKIGRKTNGKYNINPVSPNSSHPSGIPGFQFKMHIKLDVSFRKKTWMGWVNYSSETKTNIEFICNGITYQFTHNEKGPSPHSWQMSSPLIYLFTDQYINYRPIYSVPAVNASLKTDYSAFEGADGTSIIRWDCILPVENFVEY